MWQAAVSRLKLFYGNRRQVELLCAALVLVASLVILLIHVLVKPSQPAAAQPVIKPMPLSRAVLMLAEEQVRQVKPPPTETAREYAYVATAYDEALASDGQAGGLEAAGQMLKLFYPAKQDYLNGKLSYLASTYQLNDYDSTKMPFATSRVVADYTARNSNDGHNLAWNGIIPTGQGRWIKKTAKDPLTPRAGDWRRWVVSKTISVPPPPVFGSAEDLKQLQIVKLASANRNGDDINKINFWGGTPGTNGPSGVWQDQLYKTVHNLLPANGLTADKKYSSLQMNLAQTQSDAFMECWKVKFTYWTARPDMRDSSIKTAMDDPVFPGYVSGHSTISKAAADVLSVMVPSKANAWQAMAVEARNSRLVAGIHYDIDNQVGFDVGSNVAQQVIDTKKLTKIL